MSGNTDTFGVAVGHADLRTLAERGLPIAVLTLGIALGTAVVDIEERHAVRHPFVLLYALEAVILVLFWRLSGPLAPSGSASVSQGLAFFVLGGLLSLAMGLQNATLRRVGPQAVHTTYVTSVLSSLAEALVHAVLPRRASSESAGGRIGVLSALWVGYVLGAAAATTAQARWAFGSLSLPLATLLVVSVIDARQPHDVGGDFA